MKMKKRGKNEGKKEREKRKNYAVIVNKIDVLFNCKVQNKCLA
jgi:hypothetical protein